MRTNAGVENVAGALQNYASRGVFRGFSCVKTSKTHISFKILWHRDQIFELIFDVPKHTLRMPAVLPQVPAKSTIYADLKEFVAERQTEQMPPHRRIDPKKALVTCANRGGNVSITLTIKDRDYEYGTRVLVHLVDEIYKIFLNDGRYYEYMIETFDLDPDHV